MKSCYYCSEKAKRNTQLTEKSFVRKNVQRTWDIVGLTNMVSY